MSRICRLALIALLLMTQAACGFHLRGEIVLPEAMERTYIDGVPEDSVLATAVARVLERAGGNVVGGIENASALLRLQPPAFDRRVSAVDDAGKATEYQLSLQLQYRLDAADGTPLVPSRQIAVRDSYDYNSANALANSDEEERLQGDLLEEAVRRMVTQIRIVLLGGGR